MKSLVECRISVIVPAHNEELRIKECLLSIVLSTFPRELIELIVVDNNSTDSTAKIAASYADLVVSLDEMDAYKARNAGANCATSDTLFFIDADAIVTRGIFQESISAVSNGFIGGTCRKFPDIYSHFHNLIWAGYDFVDRIWSLVINRPYNFFAAFCFVDRRLFSIVGGFDSSLGVNADHVFCRKIARHGPVAYLRKNSILFCLRRLNNVGYLKYWIRTKLNRHKYYPHYE